MESPKICLTLTGKTLAEDLELLNKYRSYVDMAELRVDFLNQDERLYARRFPSMAGLPCILTIRREIDGGKFVEGESARTILFARALSFADEDKTKNFAYVDFEEDFHISSLEDATLAFETKVIRSFHDMKNPVRNILERLKELNPSGLEIPQMYSAIFFHMRKFRKLHLCLTVLTMLQIFLSRLRGFLGTIIFCLQWEQWEFQLEFLAQS